MSRMSGAPAFSRSSRELAPLSTPATIPAPARSPDSTSLAGVAGHRELADRPAAQAQQRGQRQVRPRTAAAGVGRGQRQVDQLTPAELGDDGVPGRGGEAGGQADADAGVAAGREHVRRAGQGGHGARADGRRVVALERGVGLLRRVLVAEDPPEHLDLGLAHGRPHVLHGLVVRRHGQVLLRDGRSEGIDHRAVVEHRGAGHVQAGHRDSGHRERLLCDRRGTGHAPAARTGDQHDARLGLGPMVKREAPAPTSQ